MGVTDSEAASKLAPLLSPFFKVAEAKTVKNRWHADVWVGADNVAEMSDRLTARGATFLHKGQEGLHTWVTMADREGNEFCIS